MMKKILLIALVVLVGGTVFAQSAETPPDPNAIGVDSAQQRLREISVNKFEDPGFWKVSIPLDSGVISHRRFEGNPAEKKPIEAEAQAGIKEDDKYVVGVKAEFFGRSITSLAVEPIKPLSVPGITKTISVWVVGRNFNHKLYVTIEDMFGRKSMLPLGSLNFSGWQKLTVAVPPSIEQRNPHYNTRSGIKILGFTVVTELTETIGSYFVYFDDLRVVTDLFSDEVRDPDDMNDTW